MAPFMLDGPDLQSLRRQRCQDDMKKHVKVKFDTKHFSEFCCLKCRCDQALMLCRSALKTLKIMWIWMCLSVGLMSACAFNLRDLISIGLFWFPYVFLPGLLDWSNSIEIHWNKKTHKWRNVHSHVSVYFLQRTSGGLSLRSLCLLALWVGWTVPFWAWGTPPIQSQSFSGSQFSQYTLWAAHGLSKSIYHFHP